MTAVSAGDIDLMRALNADEAVMRNLTGVSATAQQTEAEWTQRLQERSGPGRGLSYWIGWHDGAFAGWWGIGACSWDRSTANLGYRLTPSSWGMGLATEGSQALLTHAFETVGLASVWASTTGANLASQRVLTKLWMRYAGFEHEQCHSGPLSTPVCRTRSNAVTTTDLMTTCLTCS